MELTAPAPSENARDREEPFFKIVIFCEDVRAGRRAVRLLGRTRERITALDKSLKITFDFWPIELLKAPELFTTALLGTESADMILVSVSNRGNELASTLKQLLQTSLKRMGSSVGALVALLGPEEYPDCAETPRHQFLQTVARDAGIKFFSPGAAAISNCRISAHAMRAVAPPRWSPLND